MLVVVQAYSIPCVFFGFSQLFHAIVFKRHISLIYFPCKLPDEFPIKVRITIFCKLIKNKPVSNLRFIENILKTFPNIIVIFSPDLLRKRYLKNWS